MFTAAKLIAGLSLAAVGFLTSEAIRPLFHEHTDFGLFNYVNTGIGFLCGWIVIGSRAGRGYSAAISNGLTGIVALVFWGLFVQAGNEMVDRALRRFYDSPFEAVVAIFEIGLEFGARMIDPPVLATLFVGGIVSAVLAEVAAQRWR
jgi:hypothetical protein